MKEQNNPFLNASGCADPTAYHAINNLEENTNVDYKAHNLINVLKFVAGWAGFKFIGRIQLKHMKTGKEYR